MTPHRVTNPFARTVFVVTTCLLGAGSSWGVGKGPVLATDVYVAGEVGYGVTSTLIYGPSEAMLIDAQFTNSDAARVRVWIQAKHRTLTAIFLTLPVGDHYFGLAVLHAAFPGATIYMTAATVAEYDRIRAGALASSKKRAPADTPDALPEATPLRDAFLSIDGQRVDILEDLQGDFAQAPLNSAVWIAAQRVLVTGDLAFNGVHPWHRKSTEVGRAAWRASIEQLESLHPLIVIAGHKWASNLADSLNVLPFMGRYLTDADQTLKTSMNAASYEAAMKEKYPTLGQEVFLTYAAKGFYPE